MTKLWIILTSALSLLNLHECRGEIARSGGMANARTAVTGDVWTFFSNAAGLSFLSKFQAGISYTPGLFSLNELSAAYFAIGVPTPAGSLGFGARIYGNTLYNEITAGAAYSSHFSYFYFGVVCRHHNVRIDGYGSAGTFILDTGFLVRIMPALDIGLVLRNISSSVLGESETFLPYTISSGIAYRPSVDITIAIDIEKESMFPPVIRCGMEYSMAKMFTIRAGIGDGPAHYGGGIGVSVSKIRFDYGINIHRILGMTHLISITLI